MPKCSADLSETHTILLLEEGVDNGRKRETVYSKVIVVMKLEPKELTVRQL